MERNLLMKDMDYKNALDKMGFCVAPLFSLEQVQKIKLLYQQFSIDNNVSGLIASHSKIGPQKNIQLSNSIKEIVMPALENWFADFDFFMGGFMVKEAHTPQELALHQDWNILDESEYTSYQIWIPVDLSYPSNGGMYVLPGSHQFFGNYRSGSYGIPTVNTDESLRPLVTDMIIPPGSGLVFHNSLFHASYPNDSNQNRISAIVSIYQKNAPLGYYHKNKEDNCTEIYGINSEIFLSNLNVLENGGVPENPLYKKTSAIDPIDNKSIDAIDLVRESKTYFNGKEKDFEPRQLHILKDKELENQMDRDGYVVLDLLDDATVRLLKAAYEKEFGTTSTSIGRFTPMEHCTPDSKRLIHHFILDTIRPKLDSYFKDYQTPIASYFTKYARSAGDLSWHTDASIMLNTNLEPHYGIWCPLVDVTAENGALCVVEKSHKFSHVVFLPGISWPYGPYSSDFERTKKVIEIKAGQIVLFDLRLVHHATPNNTDEDRIVFCVRLTHTKSKYYSFTCETENSETVSVFEEEPNYYLRDDWSGENQAANKTKKIGEIQGIYSHINYAAIEHSLESPVTF